jgi:potassium-transporting ATPase KdpC subunit
MRSMMIAIKMTIVLTVLTGILYPLAMVGVARVVFPSQAEGSLIYRDGIPIGSWLIGQNFKSPGYFRSRPSAAGDKGYDATSSSGSNLGPTNKSLVDSVKQRLKIVLEENRGLQASQVPVDMVTASGSGLDPEISPAAADIQVQRVAKARGISEDAVRELIRSHTRSRWAGLLGEPGVNVSELNLALDQFHSSERTAHK